MRNIQSSKARDQWGDLLGMVGYGHERITIERRGKPVASLISPTDMKLLEAIEDKIDAAAARRVLEEDDSEPQPIEEILESSEE